MRLYKGDVSSNSSNFISLNFNNEFKFPDTVQVYDARGEEMLRVIQILITLGVISETLASMLIV